MGLAKGSETDLFSVLLSPFAISLDFASMFSFINNEIPSYYESLEQTSRKQTPRQDVLTSRLKNSLACGLEKEKKISSRLRDVVA